MGGGISQLTGPASVLVAGESLGNVALAFFGGGVIARGEYCQPGLRYATLVVKDVGIMVICRPS